MIESCYWKEDLLNYAKRLKPVPKPPRWTEKLQVNFEKDVTVAFFMIRKLIESHKLSSRTVNYKANIFRAPCVGKVNNSNFWNIGELYDLNNEESTAKDVTFLCNQFIHGGAMFAYRGVDRNWSGIYACSDFERETYVYRIPVPEIANIFRIAGEDYPSMISMKYSQSKGDYVIKTD